EEGDMSDVVVRNGFIEGDPNRTFRLITLDFLVDNDGGYTSLPDPTDRLVDENDTDEGVALEGSEQKALADYLAMFYPNGDMPFAMADTPPEQDIRIQNLDARMDTVLDGGMMMAMPGLIITELADPDNEAGARYLELYNPTDAAIDLSNGWTLRRWTNANPEFTMPEVMLSGTVPAGGFFVMCANEATFNATYAVTCDLDIGTGGPADSNGDDNIALARDGMVFDIFGVPGEDGTDTPHEFEDGRAERACGNPNPATIWDAAGWVIDNDGGAGDGAVNAPDGFDPGAWSCLL
ncbi:MAG: lamin tail domain-containing protein, partial [Myxococcota bacterium]